MLLSTSWRIKKDVAVQEDERIYCIAGNFRGSKLSRIRPKIIFTDLIFANFYYAAIFVPYYL